MHVFFGGSGKVCHEREQSKNIGWESIKTPRISEGRPESRPCLSPMMGASPSWLCDVSLILTGRGRRAGSGFRVSIIHLWRPSPSLPPSIIWVRVEEKTKEESHDLAGQYKGKRLAKSGTDLAQIDTI